MPAGREWITRAGTHIVLCLLLTALSAGRAEPAPAMQLRVAAGLDGVAKPGRWMPVRVDLTSPSFSGRSVLVVEWGTASLRRDIDIAAGVTRQYEFYLQTMSVGATVLVRVVANDQELAAATTPVRTLRADEAFTVCVMTNAAEPTGDCTARPAPVALPRSLRGYDAADHVIAVDAAATLSSEQRSALARWRAFKALDESGSLSATDRPRSIMPALAEKPKTPGPIRMALGVYVLALLAGGLVIATRRLRAPAALSVVALIVVAATAAATAAGRSGWPSAIVVHHATLVQQLAGATGSIVTMQGAMEFPVNGEATVHALIADGAFAATDGWLRQTLDESGYARMTGTYGVGQRQPFSLSGVVDFSPLLVVRRGPTVVVTNTSAEHLTDCRFADDAVAGTDGVLQPGASASAQLPDAFMGPVITCAVAAPPVTFSAEPRETRPTGRTILAAYLPPVDEPAP